MVDRGWNEQLLDTSTAFKRQAIASIVNAWIRACAHAGYRAVEPDNLDSYTRSQGALTASDNLSLARLLIAGAHAAGLAIAQKNAADLAGAGRRLGFDFAIAEECQPYAECGHYISAYGARVIEIEYPDNGGPALPSAAARPAVLTAPTSPRAARRAAPRGVAPTLLFAATGSSLLASLLPSAERG